MNKNNLLIGAVIVLIVLNISVLTMLFIQKNKQPPQGSRTPVSFLDREIGFDASQKNQVEDLFSDHRMQAEEIKRNIRDSKDYFFSLLKGSDTSTVQRDSVLSGIAEEERKLDLLTFDHFKKIRALCTPEQQIKFDETIEQTLHNLIPAPPPPPEVPRRPLPPPSPVKAPRP